MDTDSIQWILTAVIFPALGGLFWMIRSIASSIWESVHGIQKELNDLEVDVAKNYASNDKIEKMEARLTDHLLRIESRLDGK